MGSGIREFVADELWLLIGVVTFALAGLAAVSGFGTLSPAIAVIGWFLLAPIFLFWGEEIAEATFDESASSTPVRERGHEHEDAIGDLKRRYAAGEIDDAEFERRLDRLLAVDDALDRVFADSERGETTSNRGDGSPAVRESQGAEPDVDERDPELER